MAKFLNTSATNQCLEELIKQARERLIIISPVLRLNDRIKRLLADKDQQKVDVRLVYGKSELTPHDVKRLLDLKYVRTSRCPALHATCYVNEQAAIVTSMNLCDLSQVHLQEMGIYIHRAQEPDLYHDTYSEAKNVVRISDPVPLSAGEVAAPEPAVPDSGGIPIDKLTTTQRLVEERRLTTGRLK